MRVRNKTNKKTDEKSHPFPFEGEPVSIRLKAENFFRVIW